MGQISELDERTRGEKGGTEKGVRARVSDDGGGNKGSGARVREAGGALRERGEG